MALALVACEGRPESAANALAAPLLRIAQGYSARENSVRLGLLSVPGLRVEMLRTAGTVDSVIMLHRREVEVAFTFTDVAYAASVGRLPGLSERFDDIRAVAERTSRPMQVLVGPGSPVRSIADLRGRRVSLGPPGSGSFLTAELVLGAFGLSPEDVHVERLAFDEGARRLARGTIDASFFTGSYPDANIASAIRSGARLLDIGGPPIERARLGYPFLKLAKLPAGVYPGVDHVVHTVGVDAVIVCRADLNEDIVRRLIVGLFESALETTDVSLASRRPFDLAPFGLAPLTPIPLHPGAARYYREQELSR